MVVAEALVEGWAVAAEEWTQVVEVEVLGKVVMEGQSVDTCFVVKDAVAAILLEEEGELVKAVKSAVMVEKLLVEQAVQVVNREMSILVVEAVGLGANLAVKAVVGTELAAVEAAEFEAAVEEKLAEAPAVNKPEEAEEKMRYARTLATRSTDLV